MNSNEVIGPILFPEPIQFSCAREIPENETSLKIIAMVPFLGLAVALVNEHILLNKIYQVSENESSYLIKILKVKSSYKICSMVSTCLTVALIVAGIFLTIFNTPVGIGLAGMTLVSGGGFIALQAYRLYQNGKVIKELETYAAVPPINFLKQKVY